MGIDSPLNILKSQNSTSLSEFPWWLVSMEIKSIYNYIQKNVGWINTHRCKYDDPELRIFYPAFHVKIGRTIKKILSLHFNTMASPSTGTTEPKHNSKGLSLHNLCHCDDSLCHCDSLCCCDAQNLLPDVHLPSHTSQSPHNFKQFPILHLFPH